MKLDDPLLDNLTEEEKAQLRAEAPDLDEIMRWWAVPVLRRPKAQQAALVETKISVLRDLWEDPEAWCVRALSLGRESLLRDKGLHHDHG